MKRSELYLFGKDAAKTLLMISGVITLLGLNVATADIRNDTSKTPITFSISTGDSSVNMPDISFDSSHCDCEDAQTTCAMTPGGTATDFLMEEPIVPPPNPVENYDNSPQQTLAPVSSLNSPPPSGPGRNGYPPTPPPNVPEPPEEPEETPVTPEPATLLIMGLGLAGLGWARRTRK